MQNNLQSPLNQSITLLDVMARLGQERQRATFHLQDSREEMAQQWQRGFLFALDITLDLLKKLNHANQLSSSDNHS